MTGDGVLKYLKLLLLFEEEKREDWPGDKGEGEGQQELAVEGGTDVVGELLLDEGGEEEEVEDDEEEEEVEEDLVDLGIVE